MAAFMPGESPPLVITAMRFTSLCSQMSSLFAQDRILALRRINASRLIDLDLIDPADFTQQVVADAGRQVRELHQIGRVVADEYDLEMILTKIFLERADQRFQPPSITCLVAVADEAYAQLARHFRHLAM